MEASKSRPNVEISQLMKEQLELLKTEKELQGLIDKINSQLNQLLVCLFCITNVLKKKTLNRFT